jgi:hypothetical protein
MCFSAPASFIAGGVLVPLGVYALARARHARPDLVPLASFPLFFGLQQLVEGWVWLRLCGPDPGSAVGPGLGFLLFAHVLWPGLVPWAAAQCEPDPLRRRVFAAAALLGAAFGLSLFLPLLFEPAWLSLTLVRGSILYDARLVYDGLVSHMGLRVFYAALVCVPLIAHSLAPIRLFGILIALSVALSFAFANYAFISVWCFFAALLSVAVLAVIERLRHPA